jgi:hypothetical protein
MVKTRLGPVFVTLIAALTQSACADDAASAEGFGENVQPLPSPDEDCEDGTPISDEACSANFGDAYAVDNARDRDRFLIGRWVTCEFVESPSPYGPVEHEGFEITEDGDFFILVADGDGELQRGEGLDFEAVIEAGLNGPDSFTIEGPGEAGEFGQAIMVGSECPRKLRLDYLGSSHQGEYSMLVDP